MPTPVKTTKPATEHLETTTTSAGFKLKARLRTELVSKEIIKKVPRGSQLRIRIDEHDWAPGAKGTAKDFVVAVQCNVGGVWKDIVSKRLPIGTQPIEPIVGLLKGAADNRKDAGDYRLRIWLRPNTPATAKLTSVLSLAGSVYAAPTRGAVSPDMPSFGVGSEHLEDGGEPAELEEEIMDAAEDTGGEDTGGELTAAEDGGDEASEPMSEGLSEEEASAGGTAEDQDIEPAPEEEPVEDAASPDEQGGDDPEQGEGAYDGEPLAAAGAEEAEMGSAEGDYEEP